MRLVKRLAQLGAASRRKSEELIADGRVTVNREIIIDPARNVEVTDTIALNGRTLAEAELKTYLLNKPRGYLSTASDPHGRKKVTELIPSELRLFPVGRLDSDTTGVILLTNDGELANRLTHPRYQVPKTYMVEVEGQITKPLVQRLAKGVYLKDGETAPGEARLISASEHASTVELTIREGRNRQVRRMLEAVGHPVKRLERVAFGPLTLSGLAAGAYRELTDDELAQLSA